MCGTTNYIVCTMYFPAQQYDLLKKDSHEHNVSTLSLCQRSFFDVLDNIGTANLYFYEPKVRPDKHHLLTIS